VVGAALEGLERVMSAECYRTFQPIGGLHHARRGSGAGFCVFNDCGVVIETLRKKYSVKRVAYVDIDVHHGDGLLLSVRKRPRADRCRHTRGRHVSVSGTGGAEERGKGEAGGTKLNIPMQPGAGDADFFVAWERVVDHLRHFKPEFIIFQCGADSLAAIRSRISGIRRRRTRMRRVACASSQTKWPAGASWGSAAAVTIAPIWRWRGTRC